MGYYHAAWGVGTGGFGGPLTGVGGTFFCEIDSWVLGACNSGILLLVLFWNTVWGGGGALQAVLLEVLARNGWHVFR